MEIRRSYDRLISTMGFPLLVRCHLYIGSGPCLFGKLAIILKQGVYSQVESSLRGLGAVLMQEGHPMTFTSKSPTDTESRYANIERELLAVVYGCECFHSYLYYGKPFTARSDHKPLETIQLKNLHAVPPRLQCMLLRLQN